MRKKELQEILEQHKLWLDNNRNGKRADLSYADLRGADLRGANLDYSCLPLWCGSLGVHFDDRQLIQILYHLLYNVQYSKNASQDLKDNLLTKNLIDLANEFHREECKRLEVLGE